jgi:hypothetical protein
MTLDFGNVLTRAWQIIWKHKVLWIFGIFAGCSRGGGSWGGPGNSGGSSTNPFGDDYIAEQVGTWLADNLWVVIAAVVVILGFAVLAAYLGTVGRIALVRGTFESEAGAERLAFGELFAAGNQYFWRVFGLWLVLTLATSAIFVPLALLGVVTAGVGFICMLPVLCILIPAAALAGVVVEQATVAIVTEDLRMMDGLRCRCSARISEA